MTKFYQPKSPMLAKKTDGKDLKFPVLVSPKLDGVRALVVGGEVLSRKFKPIPNKHVQKMFGFKELHGLDGELIVGPAGDPFAFSNTTKGIMAFEGMPDVKFYVFDDFSNSDVFEKRLRSVRRLIGGFADIIPVLHELVSCYESLLRHEEDALTAGFEGLMIRDINGRYKEGRSTAKEGGLLKLKHFEDSEAVITGFKELQSNQNELITKSTGLKERSHNKSGMVACGTLGAFMVKDIHSGVEFDLGSGFTADDRRFYWGGRRTLAGMIVKYKFFPLGVKDKPRFPTFLGFRDEIDI